MSRRFKQLLNLYLDNVIDQRGLIELKNLLANNVENQREFQRQCRLQQAMKQVQRTWVLAETSTQRAAFWRKTWGLAAMAAIAVFGCLFWLQSIKFTAPPDDVQSFVSTEPGANAIDATNFANNNVFFVDSDLDEIPILRPQYVGMSHSLGQMRHTIRPELLLPNDWGLHPDEGLDKARTRALSRTWNFQPSMQQNSARDNQVLEAYPFVQPANFSFP